MNIIYPPPEGEIVDQFRESNRFHIYPRVPDNSNRGHCVPKYMSINPYEKFSNGKGLNFSEDSNFSCICDNGAIQLVSCYRDCDGDLLPEHFNYFCKRCKHYIGCFSAYDKNRDMNIWLPYHLITYMEENELFPTNGKSKWRVYFITDGNYVKIGKTNNLKNRLSGIQTGNPNELKVLFTVPCKSETVSYDIETRLHNIYHDYHMNGEWYNILKHLNIKVWTNEMSYKEVV